MNKEAKTTFATIMAFLTIGGIGIRNVISQDRLTLQAGAGRKNPEEILKGDDITIIARDNSGHGGKHIINLNEGTFKIEITERNFTTIEGETDYLGIKTGKSKLGYEKDGYETELEIEVLEK